MTNCTSEAIQFPACRKRRVEAGFDGGEVTSNGGVLLLRQADRLVGLTGQVARGLADERQPGKVRHRSIDMLRQRVFGIALGYEDVNDHAALRHDLAVQTAAERDAALASPSTLSRFENRADRQSAWRIHEVLVDRFIASHARPPEEIVLDFDATDDAVHGHQVGRFFHGYYDHYCFLPLYVFCGEQLLVAYLRPSKIDAAKHAWAILSLLVKRLRQVWPEVRIVVRADTGFCRVACCVGAIGTAWAISSAWPRTPARHAFAGRWMKARDRRFSGKQPRAAYLRRIPLCRQDLEPPATVHRPHGTATSKGANPRYVVTNLTGDRQDLYAEALLRAQATVENR